MATLPDAIFEKTSTETAAQTGAEVIDFQTREHLIQPHTRRDSPPVAQLWGSMPIDSLPDWDGRPRSRWRNPSK